MLKDKRDDFDENEDADLSGMIHQYNEENELRRKINEMKKQKAENNRNTSVEMEDDNVFIPSSNKQYEEDHFPNIRADHDVDKTRVGFQDDSDKTLVIMDRKTKVEPEYREEPQETSYTREEYSTEPQAEEEQDLRETVRKKKADRRDDDSDDEELSAKDKKINKTITYVIIGVLSIALLVGIGFGVKTLFFNGSSDEQTTDVEEEKEKNTTKKEPTKKDNPDIKDNTAVIKQLEEQRTTYEDQLAQVERDIATAEGNKTEAQNGIDKIKSLDDEKKAIKAQIADIQATYGVTSIEGLKAKKDETCTLDKKSEACTTITTSYGYYQNLDTQYPLKEHEYNTYKAKESQYTSDRDAADTKIASLGKQKTDLESKIADITTKLATYED